MGERGRKGEKKKIKSNFYKIREPGCRAARDPPVHDMIVKQVSLSK